MSNKIALESRQRLPNKLQNIICDSALVMQHAACAAGSSEMLNSRAKQLCVAEQFFGATSTSLDKLDAALNAMQQRSDEVESKYVFFSLILKTKFWSVICGHVL
uniref:BLOC-1-related complex subunit 7 n=1 Tax=Angiostrongylus cantonensis TaxID=6313 RepID=A0A0K0DQW7_ANGCA